MKYAVYCLIIHALFVFGSPFKFLHIVIFHPAEPTYTGRYSVHRFIHDEYVSTVMSVQFLVYPLCQYFEPLTEVNVRVHVLVCFINILFRYGIRSIAIFLICFYSPSEIISHDRKTPVAVPFRVTLIHMLKFILCTHQVRGVKSDKPVDIIRCDLHFLLQKILYVFL